MIPHYAVHAGGKWAYTGYDGQIWVDPATFDLRHLLVRTAELPSESNACESSTTVDYASIPIGDGEFLLPLDSNLHFLMRDTTETEVRINYSSCHQFLGEAKLVEQPDLAVSQPTPRASPVPIAAGLLISLKFTQAIDSDVAAAGDVLLAKVTKAVRDPASSKVLIAAGSLVQARLVGMEHWLGQTPRFAFTIQLETVELEGVTTPIYARLPTASEEKDALKKKPDLMVRNEFYLAPRGQSRPAAHHVIYTKDKRCAIPRGYQMRFVTVDPAATQ